MSVLTIRADYFKEIAEALQAGLKDILRSEIVLPRQLYKIQSSDSRIGFEATNQYYCVPQDLLEKVINCEHLLNEIQ